MTTTQPTILIADDEDVITFMLSSKLSNIGAKVITARNGEEAFVLAMQYRPLVVLTDYEMPRMTGLEFAKKLRATPELAEVPVVMLTARGHRVPPGEMSQTNIQNLVSKPFSAKELSSLMQEHLAAELARRSSKQAA